MWCKQNAKTYICFRSCMVYTKREGPNEQRYTNVYILFVFSPSKRADKCTQVKGDESLSRNSTAHQTCPGSMQETIADSITLAPRRERSSHLNLRAGPPPEKPPPRAANGASAHGGVLKKENCLQTQFNNLNQNTTELSRQNS